MGLRTIVEKGESCLGKKCRDVVVFDKRLHLLLDDMHETLAHAQGAGLAGPQVGVLRRVALVMLEDESYLEIINPKIIHKDGEQDGVEGCLSVPGIFGMVKRPLKVTVTAQDRNGKSFTYDAEGFTARAFCHEIDHLDGHLFTELVHEYIDADSYYEEDDEEVGR